MICFDIIHENKATYIEPWFPIKTIQRSRSPRPALLLTSSSHQFRNLTAKAFLVFYTLILLYTGWLSSLIWSNRPLLVFLIWWLQQYWLEWNFVLDVQAKREWRVFPERMLISYEVECEILKNLHLVLLSTECQ